MTFKHYDALWVFQETARHSSFSAAADAMNMTKGAISYQINTLEQILQMPLFVRKPRGVTLTAAGRTLLNSCKAGFAEIDRALDEILAPTGAALTIGMSSYFASRWLSPRLMTFMQRYPETQLRIQPMTQLFDLQGQGIDLAIRWGNGDWNDMEIRPFMSCPAWPTGNQSAAEKVSQLGLAAAFSEFTLLRDRDDSNAWSDWFVASGLPQQNRKDTLIIPDPNVRVQAVIDGQGIALNDTLVSSEIENGQLVRLSDVSLKNYGYFLAIPNEAKDNPCVQEFADWIMSQ